MQAACSVQCRPVAGQAALKSVQLSSVKAFRAVPLVASRPVAARSSALSQSVVAKAAAAQVEAAPEAVAYLRFIRGSAYKVRRVLDQIRGRSYEEAIMILEYMPYRACDPVLKTLLSAAANAKQNLGMRKAKLVVSECFADEGPVLKRSQPRAQGRAYPILKPMVHITIKVRENEA